MGNDVKGKTVFFNLQLHLRPHLKEITKWGGLFNLVFISASLAHTSFVSLDSLALAPQ